MKVGHGQFLKERHDGISFFYGDEWKDIGYFLNKDDFIVESFAGFYDKYDCSIYEGDIVRFVEKDTDIGWFEVVEYDIKFGFNYFFGNVCNNIKEIEVMGNIHEHPYMIEHCKSYVKKD